MLKPVTDRRVLDALASLSNDRDWNIVAEWLGESLESLTRECTTQTDDTLLRMVQGAAQAVSGLLEQQKGARAALEKIRKRTDTGGNPSGLY